MELIAFQLSDPWLTIVFMLIISLLTYLMYAIYKSDWPSD